MTPATLTPDEKASLAAVFAVHSSVCAAYVLGSAATGQRNARSDLDLAVWLRNDVSPHAAKLDLLTDLTRAGFDNVDLVVLNDADLTVRYGAIRPNQLVYATDDYDHGHVFSLTLRKYWDFLPYLKVQRVAYKQRLKHGQP